MTVACERARTAVALGDRDDAETTRHLATCDACRAEAAALQLVAARLAAAPVPQPSPALAARVRAAAAPLLARHARAALWQTVGRAVAAAVLPLPLLLLIDHWLLRTAYDALRAVLPDAVSLYFVLNYTTLLALLLTLAYGAIPFLAERQARVQSEERYG